MWSRKFSIRKQFYFILLVTLFLCVNIIQINTPKQDNTILAATTGNIFDYSVAINEDNQLFLVYREKYGTTDYLRLLVTNSEMVWGNEPITLLQENETFTFDGSLSICFNENSSFIVTAYKQNLDSGILLLNKNNTAESWTVKKIVNGINANFIDPILQFDSTNETFWLTWMDDRDGIYNQYLITTDSITSWENTTCISVNASMNNYGCDFIIGSNGNGYFALSEGLVYQQQIFFEEITSTHNIIQSEAITNNSYSNVDPDIIFDSSNLVNIFWTNYTVQNPGEFLGKVFVYGSYRSLSGTWSTPINVAPYIPPDRSASGESDAYNPSVAIDTQNQLWLAYEIVEDYAYHSGVDIRNRIGSGWQPSSYLSLVTNRATDPLLLSDDTGGIHCFWLDRRQTSVEIYYRYKYQTNIITDEKCLTCFKDGTNYYFLMIFGIVIGAAIILALPTTILRYILRKRNEKAIREKLRNLE